MKANRILYITLVLLSILALILDNNKISLGILIILVTIPLISLILFVIEKRFVKVYFNYPSTISKNSKFEYKIEISSKHSYFLGSAILKIAFHNKTFDLTDNLTRKCKFGFKGIALVVDELAKNAGLVNVNFTNFTIYDVLGLFSSKINNIDSKTILIIPKVYSTTKIKFLSEIKNEAEENYQELSGKYKDYSSVDSIHTYQQGDLMNAIHWKLTSKFDKLMVKDFKSTSDFNPLIILNIAKQYPNDDDSVKTNNILYDIATSVMSYCVNVNRPFTLLMNKEGSFYYQSVDSVDEFTIVMNSFLSAPIIDNMNELLLNSLFEIVNQKHNRVIFIDNYTNSYVAHEFSESVGVSELTLGNRVEELEMDNYRIIAIDRDKLESTLANIVF